MSLLTAIYYFVFLVYCNFWTFYDRTDPAGFVEKVRKYIALGLTYTDYDSYIYFGCATSIFIPITAICVGVLFSFASYRFLMKKKCVNVYLSMGVDRRTIFKNRTLASMLLMAVTSAVPIVIDIIMNIYFLGDPTYIISHGIYVFLEYYTYMLVGFSMMSIAMLICNNVLECLVFGAGFIWFPTVLLGSLHMLFSTFLRGYGNTSFLSSGVEYGRSFMNYMSIFNPIFFGKPLGNYSLSVNTFSFVCRGVKTTEGSDVYYNTYENYGKEVIPFEYMLPVIIWLAVCAVFILAARRIFLARKAENAGIFGVSSFVNTFIALEVSVFTAAAVIRILNSLGDKISNLLVFIIGVAVFAILYYVILSIERRKIKHSKKSVIPSAVTACIMGVTVVVLVTGGFGYSTRIPDFDDVKYATISSNAVDAAGTQSFKYYEGYYNPGSEIINSYNYANFVLVTEDEDLQKLADIHKALAEKTDDMTGSKVSVMYVLNDGSYMTRTYNTTDYDACYNILSLTDTKAYENELKYLLSSEEKNNYNGNITKISGNFYDYDCFFTMQESTAKNILHDCDTRLVLPNKDIVNINNTDELKDAILEDMLSLTYDQIYKSDEKPLATIVFLDGSYGNYLDGVDEYSYCIPNTISYNLYPSMSNTVNYLKSTGEYDLITEDNSFEKFTITSAKIMEYSDVVNTVYENDYLIGEYASPLFDSTVYGISTDAKTQIEYYTNPITSVFADTYEITDAEKMQALAEASTSFGYASPDDYMVYFENPSGSGYTALLRADKTPEFIK
ncbi:MAG: hypothetical protein ACI4V4_06295 [Eubacterium sp.]